MQSAANSVTARAVAKIELHFMVVLLASLFPLTSSKRETFAPAAIVTMKIKFNRGVFIGV
jgi:hypothetical protein